MENTPQIRNAKIEDASSIARVHKNSWLSTYKGIISDAYLEKVVARYNSGESQKRREDSISKDGGKSTFVAIVEDKIVGFADGGPNRFSEYPFDTEIYAIYLEEEYQRLGIGKMLIERFMNKYVIESGYKSLSIHVLEKNSSAEFYRKMGGTLHKSKWEDIADANLEVQIFSWDDCKTHIQKLNKDNEL